MARYLVEIFEMELTITKDDQYHAMACAIVIIGRSERGVMAQALQHCRDENIRPCEIRILNNQ